MILSELETPGITRGIKLAADGERSVGDIRHVGNVQGRATERVDRDGDRIMANSAVHARGGIGVSSVDEKRGPCASRLGDRAQRERRAVAPIDRDVAEVAKRGGRVGIGEGDDGLRERLSFGCRNGWLRSPRRLAEHRQ